MDWLCPNSHVAESLTDGSRHCCTWAVSCSVAARLSNGLLLGHVTLLDLGSQRVVFNAGQCLLCQARSWHMGKVRLTWGFVFQPTDLVTWRGGGCHGCLLRHERFFLLVPVQKVTCLEQSRGHFPLLYCRWVWPCQKSFGKRGHEVAGGVTKTTRELFSPQGRWSINSRGIGLESGFSAFRYLIWPCIFEHLYFYWIKDQNWVLTTA